MREKDLREIRFSLEKNNNFTIKILCKFIGIIKPEYTKIQYIPVLSANFIFL